MNEDFNEKMLNQYKEMYYHEFEHKDQLNARIAIPAGIVPILGAAMVFMLDHIDDVKHGAWSVVSLTAITLFVIGLLTTLYFIFRTLHNYQYRYVPGAKKILDYKKSLEDSGLYDEMIIQEEMIEFLSTEFAINAEVNRASNLRKIRNLRFTYYAIVGTLIAGVLCIMPFTIGKKPDADVHKITVTDAVYIKGGEPNVRSKK